MSDSSASSRPIDPAAAVEEVRDAYQRLTSEIHKVIVGQEEAVLHGHIGRRVLKTGVGAEGRALHFGAGPLLAHAAVEEEVVAFLPVAGDVEMVHRRRVDQLEIVAVDGESAQLLRGQLQAARQARKQEKHAEQHGVGFSRTDKLTQGVIGDREAVSGSV